MSDDPPTSSNAAASMWGWLRRLPRRDWTEYENPTRKRTVRTILFWSATSACAIIGSWLLTYLEGRFNPGLGLLLFASLTMLVALIASASTLTCTIIALFRRDLVRVSLLVSLGLATIWLLATMIFPHPFLLGLKGHVLSKMTTDELRIAAAKARELIHGPDRYLDPSSGTGISDGRDLLWTEFAASPGVAKLGNQITVASLDDGVEIFWNNGGWGNRWGVRLAVGESLPAGMGGGYWRWQKDIAFFSTSE